MLNVASCPSPELLQQALLGQLDDQQAAEVEAHLLDCMACWETSKSLPTADPMVSAMRVAPEIRDLQAEFSNLVARVSLRLSAGDTHSSAAQREVTQELGKDSGAHAEIESPAILSMLRPAEAGDELGRLGSFRVLRKLGQGGMGIVFEAEDLQLRRRVAIKVLSPEQRRTAELVERFLREARAAAAVKHDHIVTIYQVGQDGPTPFIAMELLEGESLAASLKREERLSPQETIRIGREVALGLAAAHARGLLHRDIKPANICLEAGTGRVKILDFGLARAMQDDVHLTQSGLLVGTPSYMAPEQATADSVDGQADLFSLGCVLYRVSTGQLPFRGANSLAVLTALANDTPMPPQELNPAVSSELSALIMQLLSKEPQQRPAGATALIAALQSLASQNHEPRRQSLGNNGSPPRRRPPRALVAAGFGAFALFVFAVWVIIRDRDGKELARVKAPDDATIIVQHERSAQEVGIEKTKPVDAAIDHWTPGPVNGVLPGYVPQPTQLPGIAKWQVQAIAPAEIASPTIGTPLWSPDGKRLMVPADKSLHFYEYVAGRLAPSGVFCSTNDLFLRYKTGYNSFAWAPDSQGFFVSGEQRGIKGWKFDGQKLLADTPIPVATSGKGRLAWSRDRKWLAILSEFSGNDRLTLRVWSATEGNLATAIELGPVHRNNDSSGFAWHPDGKQLAIIIRSPEEPPQSTVKLYDVSNWQNPTSFQLDGAKAILQWTPDGKQLMASSAGRSLGSTEAFRAETIDFYESATGSIRRVAAHAPWGGSSLSPDGQWFTAAIFPGTTTLLSAGSIRLHRVSDGQLEPSIGPIFSAGEPTFWHPSAPPMLTQVSSHVVSAFDIGSLTKKKLLEAPPPVRGVAWSPDGEWIATFGYGDLIVAPGSEKSTTSDHHIRLWHAATGRPGPLLRGHTEDVTCVCWSPDGKWLASGGKDRRGLLWEMATGKPLMFTNNSTIEAISFSPDGKLLASGGNARAVQIWNCETGQPHTEFNSGGGNTTALAWGPDGRELAVKSGRNIYISNLASGTEALKINDGESVSMGANYGISALAWSPTDQRLLGNYIWNRDGSKSEQQWPRTDPTKLGIARLVMSPDGQRLGMLLTGGGGWSVRLFDLAAWRMTAEFVLPRYSLPSGTTYSLPLVSFSPDGQRLAVVAGANTIEVRDTFTSTVHWRGAVLSAEHSASFTPAGEVMLSAATAEAELIHFLQYDDGSTQILTRPELVNLQSKPQAKPAGVAP